MLRPVLRRTLVQYAAIGKKETDKRISIKFFRTLILYRHNLKTEYMISLPLPT